MADTTAEEEGETEAGMVTGVEAYTETTDMAETETDPTVMSYWKKVVVLVHTALQEGRLSEEAMCQVVVLITKGGGDYHGISLVEVVWKVVMVILNLRFTTYISFHDIIHGFRECQGTGTASLKAKLIHQLTATREEVLYGIFLDLHKAYGTLDRDRCL